ncbi:hypothetical protein CVIRNUC_005140 [Coccomyxa viridis]|uniref:Uncharacterized protein n=1 Tax=Coccomyxa viridis TaxID=1274662 RepID=A0AAV1I6U5_9CHLO|nr:hypothetical protein CVIRNUC_005140 [Coccomyxa viridis]
MANTTPRSPAGAGLGPGRPQSTASQAHRSLPSRLGRDAVKRRTPAARRSMMTHLPAALQRSLAWQSTLLFDWDGIDDR